MSLHTDKQGRTWNVLEREDGSISVYYTRPGVGAHMVVYDSSDALQPSPAPAECGCQDGFVLSALSHWMKVPCPKCNSGVSRWLPIDMAPLDESKILISDGKDVAYVWGDGTGKEFYHRTNEMGYRRFSQFRPTHWQPLPAPPQADEVCECGGTGSIPRGLDMWDRMNGEEIPCPKCTGKAAEVDHA